MVSQFAGNPIAFITSAMLIVVRALSNTSNCFLRARAKVLNDDLESMILKIMTIANKSFFPQTGLLSVPTGIPIFV